MIALLVAVAAGLFPVALSATPAASGPSASGTDTAMETAAASFADLIARARGQMQRDPALAVRLSRAAQTLAENRAPSPSRDVDVATSKWLQGEALIRLNQLAPAAPLIREALASIGRLAPNTKLHGDALLSQAAIDTANGSPDKALADFQRAYQIFKEAREPRSQAIALQSMASIYQDAGDYRKVFNYYSQAAEAFPNDLPLSLSASNNLANSLVKQGKYKDAETEYNRALRFATALGSPLLQARILNNIARAQIGENDLGAAQASLARGLLLARGGEAAGWRPVLLGTAASLALKQDRAAEAARLVSEAFAKVDLATTTQIFRDMHQTAYLAYKREGQDRLALEHLEAWKRLDDQGRSLAASTTSALMGAKFDSVNQQERISSLKANKLQSDIALTRLRTRQSLIVLVSLLILVSVVAVLMSVHLRSLRRSRNAIRAANLTLTEVNAELEEALLAKSQFLATTSHEIRTPLNGVLGMTQVLLADAGVTGSIRERIGLVHGAGETMRALVDDILSFAKIEAGKVETHRTEMSLGALLKEVVNFWKSRADIKGLELRLDMTNCPTEIIEDAGHLRQILFNLLANAIKFTDRGAVGLVASIAGPVGQELLVVEVEDSGIGIPDGAFETIFEKFRQLDGGTTRRFGGTGLGLAISRNLARTLDGDIAVASRLGEGSTFTLRLPLHRAAATPSAAAPTAAPHRPGSLAASSLVIVGATPIAQASMRALLKPQVAALAVADVAGATDMIRECGANLVLFDATSTQDGGDGIDRIAAFAAGLRSTGTLVAVLWSPPPDVDMATFRIDGVDCFIARPVTGATLIRWLQEVFDQPSAIEQGAGQPRVLFDADG